MINNRFSFSVWQPDLLGDRFEMMRVRHIHEIGVPTSTIVRAITDSKIECGVLYIHGYNDYFFQSHLADVFVARRYGFYAVDLRGYGRSITSEDIVFDVSDVSEYFADIDAAIEVMREQGIKNVILMGHSTGGLIASVYLNTIKNDRISALILNSPFLEWNLPFFLRNVAIPMVAEIGKYFPNILLKQPTTKPYSESLLKAFHGEWDYNTSWKFIEAPMVTSRWIRAIDIAQKQLHRKSSISIPILLMRSDYTVKGRQWNELFNRGDAILNVDDISRWGMRLGNNVSEKVFEGGLHDLTLSNIDIRNKVFATMLEWLRDINKCH